MNKWNFTEKARDEKMRNPVSGEFFSAIAIISAGEALIREAVQNSLDAQSTESMGGSVRIFHSGSKEALIPTTHKKWFENAWSRGSYYLPSSSTERVR